ncbi:helix-turn-helix domain-containing protein [Streptomyces sp. NPDC091280]|uniref:helix-turn-helix domain-containing protein n=1 Tax=Streptomyces sp. NPDC091280 TaxID=3365984 RepID=UPI0038007A9D
MNESMNATPEVRVITAPNSINTLESARDWESVRDGLSIEASDLAEDLEILMARLRQERKRQGLTQAAVAQKMKVSQSRVSAIETGAIKATEVGTLARYLNALGVRLKLTAEFRG